MRIAAIDIGTNTAQLLVADVDGAHVQRLHVAERFVRLGKGVDAENRIGAAARDRLIEALGEHLETVRTFDVDTVSAAATSALRDATNRDAVIEAVQQNLGLSIEILTAREEAAWSFAAACSAFESLRGPCLVVDIGGGSTELVWGKNPADHHPNYPDAIEARASLDIGCIRLTERCFSSQPPAPDEVDAAARLIDRTLQSQSSPEYASATLVATAGTATALALVHAGRNAAWDALAGGSFQLSRAEVRHWREKLFDLSTEQVLALHPDAMRGRADVFPVGVLLLDRIMAHYDRDVCRISPYELRHGLALRVQANDSNTSTKSSS